MSTGACGRRVRPVAAPKSYGEVCRDDVSIQTQENRTNETKASGSKTEEARSRIC